jgi:uncharacterized membrane protein
MGIAIPFEAAIRAAFGAIGLSLLLAGPLLGLAKGWSTPEAVFISIIGASSLGLAVLMFLERRRKRR